MNEAERYLKEKLNPSQSVNPKADVKARPPNLPDKDDPLKAQPAAICNQQGDSPAGKYILAVVVCLAIIAAYIGVAAMMGWRSGGGYVVKVLVFMAVIGAWKAITSKQ